MKVRQRTVPHTVFATARFSRSQQVGGHLRREPASRVHAKTMGTTVTLCGQSALSWFKFWDIAFVTVRADRCPACNNALASRLASGQAS